MVVAAPLDLASFSQALNRSVRVGPVTRTAVVVEPDPVTDGAGGVLDAFEAMAMHALLFQRPDDAFDHAVLLRTMRGDELLLQAVVSDQSRVVATGKTRPLSDRNRNS